MVLFMLQRLKLEKEFEGNMYPSRLRQFYAESDKLDRPRAGEEGGGGAVVEPGRPEIL
jgi:hypothetical protein